MNDFQLKQQETLVQTHSYQENLITSLERTINNVNVVLEVESVDLKSQESLIKEREEAEVELVEARKVMAEINERIDDLLGNL